MASNAAAAVRKRRRPALSCEPCRKRKIKCNRCRPCEHCTLSSIGCTYTATHKTSATKHLTSVFSQHDGPPARLPSQSGASNTTVGGSPPSTENTLAVQQLADKVQELEQRLTDAAVARPEWNSGSPVQQSSFRGPMKGIFSKSRYFGQSHWMNCCVPPSVQHVVDICRQHEADPTSEIHRLLQACKTTSRGIKARERILSQVTPHLSDYVPVRAVADKLVQSYLDTFESVYPVLHIPSFSVEYKTYWLDPKMASHTFVTKMLLIMAIGTLFQPQDEVVALRSSALQWIYVAQTWVSTPFDKHRLTAEGLQIQCLLLLARLAYDVDGDLLWLSAGYLVRAAMHMGLHIDAESYTFRKPRPQEIQHRRKLWTTVLEIVVQTSLDSGGLPMINADDYDCKPPLNADDREQRDGFDDVLTTVQPPDQFTQSSLQIMLARSLPLRLEIAAFVNNFRPESGTYDKTMRLSERLLKECSTNSSLLQTFAKSSSSPTDFQVNLVELVLHQFLFALHWPYALKARSDRTFYYSRKVCLDTALLVLSNSSQTQDDAYAHLRIWGGGLFRAIPLTSTSFLIEELFTQIETDDTFFSKNATLLDRRNELRSYIHDYVEFSLVRLKHGQPNVRCYILFSAVLAQVEALLDGHPVEESIVATLQQSLAVCYEVLQAQFGGSPPQSHPTKSDTQLRLGISDTGGYTPEMSDGWLGLDDFESMDSWFPFEVMDPVA